MADPRGRFRHSLRLQDRPGLRLHQGRLLGRLPSRARHRAAVHGDRRLLGLRRDLHRDPVAVLSMIGGLIAFGSFGSIMLATRLDKVGEAAVLRETSTVFAAVIGWLVLKETVGPRRLTLMALIALGAVIVEFGSGQKITVAGRSLDFRA